MFEDMKYTFGKIDHLYVLFDQCDRVNASLISAQQY